MPRLTESERFHRLGRLGMIVRFGPIILVLILVLLFGLYTQDRIGHATFTVLVLLSPVVAAGGAIAIGGLLDRTAGGFINLIFSGTSAPPHREYSEQDALVAQGRIEDAIASYRAIIAQQPRDLDARIRLASLLADAGRHDAAEREYLDIRASAPSPRHVRALSNGLIDLYRTMGREEEMRLELRRFARRFKDTKEGKAAEEYLKRMV